MLTTQDLHGLRDLMDKKQSKEYRYLITFEIVINKRFLLSIKTRCFQVHSIDKEITQKNILIVETFKNRLLAFYTEMLAVEKQYFKNLESS